MSDAEPIMRPVEREDLEVLRRFSIEPEALGEFDWFGFTDPNVQHRRWEQDGLIGTESST